MNAVTSACPRLRTDPPDWTMVCRLGDLLPGAGVAALVGGRVVAIFRLRDDSVFVIDNVDPFSGASILSRGIVGDIEGDPVVASPIFKQHFRLADGRCIEDDTVAVSSYRCLVVDGAVIVQAARK